MFFLVQISIDSSFFFLYLFVFVRVCVCVSEICSHIIINQCKVLDRDHSNGCKERKGSFSPSLKLWRWNIIHACFAAVPNRDIYRQRDWWWSFELKHDLLIAKKVTGSVFVNCFSWSRTEERKWLFLTVQSSLVGWHLGNKHVCICIYSIVSNKYRRIEHSLIAFLSSAHPFIPDVTEQNCKEHTRLAIFNEFASKSKHVESIDRLISEMKKEIYLIVIAKHTYAYQGRWR